MIHAVTAMVKATWWRKTNEIAALGLEVRTGREQAGVAKERKERGTRLEIGRPSTGGRPAERARAGSRLVGDSRAITSPGVRANFALQARPVQGSKYALSLFRNFLMNVNGARYSAGVDVELASGWRGGGKLSAASFFPNRRHYPTLLL